jgi:DNA-binding transcriptional regulator YiaG
MPPLSPPDLVHLGQLRALTSSGEARALRLATGLSLGEVARQVGVRPSVIFKWETGERRPRDSEDALRYYRLLRMLRSARPAAS